MIKKVITNNFFYYRYAGTKKNTKRAAVLFVVLFHTDRYSVASVLTKPQSVGDPFILFLPARRFSNNNHDA